MWTYLKLGLAVSLFLPFAGCATGTGTLPVDRLTPSQRARALLTSADPPRANCTINVASPPAPADLVDMQAFRAALRKALPALPDTGHVLLSVQTDSMGTIVDGHILDASLPDSTAAAIVRALRGHTRNYSDDKDHQHPAGWDYRLRIAPGTADLITVGQPVECRPQILDKSAIRQRLEQDMNDYDRMSAPPAKLITVAIWLFVGADGRPIKEQVQRSSGDAEVDHLAVDAASVARFAPALSDGEPVGVWVSLPLSMGWATRRMPANKSLMPPL